MNPKELELENIKFFTELLQEELQDELQEDLLSRNVQVIRAVRSERSGKVQFLLTASINGFLYLEKNSNCMLCISKIAESYRREVNAIALAKISAAANAINEAAAVAAAEKEAKLVVKTPTLAESEARTLSLEKSLAIWEARNAIVEAKILELDKAIALAGIPALVKAINEAVTVTATATATEEDDDDDCIPEVEFEDKGKEPADSLFHTLGCALRPESAKYLFT
jgi:hypothetical protein